MQGKFSTTRSGNRKSSGTEEQDKERRWRSSDECECLGSLPLTAETSKQRGWKESQSMEAVPLSSKYCASTFKSPVQPAPGKYQRKTARPTDLRTVSQCPASLSEVWRKKGKFSDLQNLGIPKITKIKSRPISSNSTPGYIPKITESRDLNRYLQTPVDSSILHNT